MDFCFAFPSSLYDDFPGELKLVAFLFSSSPHDEMLHQVSVFFKMSRLPRSGRVHVGYRRMISADRSDAIDVREQWPVNETSHLLGSVPRLYGY